MAQPQVSKLKHFLVIQNYHINLNEIIFTLVNDKKYYMKMSDNTHFEFEFHTAQDTILFSNSVVRADELGTMTFPHVISAKFGAGTLQYSKDGTIIVQLEDAAN